MYARTLKTKPRQPTQMDPQPVLRQSTKLINDYRYKDELELAALVGNNSNALSPKPAILEVAEMQPDGTGIHANMELMQQSSTKIQEILDEYKNKITYLPSENCSALAVTAKFPTELVQILIEVLESVDIGCRNKVANALQLLRSLTKNADEDTYSITRAVFTALVEAYNELDEVERKININSSIMATLTKPIATPDFTSVPSNEFLETSLSIVELEDSAAAVPIDAKFIAANPDVTINEPDIEDAFMDVQENNPNSLAENGVDSTSSVAIDLSDMSDDVPIIKEEEPEHNDAIQGLKNLFSAKMLLTPLKNLKWIFQSELVTIQSGTDFYEVLANRVTSLTDDTPVAPDLSGLDEDRGYLEQDFGVTPTPTTLTTLRVSLKQPVAGMIAVHELAMLEVDPEHHNTLLYVGLSTRRTYTHADILKLSKGLSSVWNKMKSVSFPSASTLSKALNLVTLGTACVGAVTGKQDILNASNYMGVFANGFGELYGKSSLRENRSTPTSFIEARKYKVGLSSLPSIIQAGIQTVARATTTKRSMRSLLGRLSKLIINGYKQYAAMNANSSPATYVNLVKRRHALRR